MNNFKERCFGILEKALALYDEFGCQYEHSIYEKIRKSLIDNIYTQLFICFDLQLKLIRYLGFESFDKELRK